ncbi:hypothetical protein MMPV_005761 [Pyropia vietnamensis]
MAGGKTPAPREASVPGGQEVRGTGAAGRGGKGPAGRAAAKSASAARGGAGPSRGAAPQVPPTIIDDPADDGQRAARNGWSCSSSAPSVAGPARSASAPPDEESDAVKVAGPKGRRRLWSEALDVLGLKAILGVSAHVAARGTRTKRFQEAADAFNAHPQAAFTTKKNTLRDHFNQLRKQFSAADKKKASQSGQEEQLSERDRILADMVDAMDEVERLQDAKKGTETKKNQKLAADGLMVRKLAIERHGKRVKVGDGGSGAGADALDDSTEAASTGGPSSRKRRRRDVMDPDDDDFIEVLERSESRRDEREKAQIAEAKQERRFRRDVLARRDAADRELRARLDRLERVQREDRDAHLEVLVEILRKLRE